MIDFNHYLIDIYLRVLFFLPFCRHWVLFWKSFSLVQILELCDIRLLMKLLQCPFHPSINNNWGGCRLHHSFIAWLKYQEHLFFHSFLCFSSTFLWRVRYVYLSTFCKFNFLIFPSILYHWMIFLGLFTISNCSKLLCPSSSHQGWYNCRRLMQRIKKNK